MLVDTTLDRGQQHGYERAQRRHALQPAKDGRLVDEEASEQAVDVHTPILKDVSTRGRKMQGT